MEVEELKAGRELDALIAEKVMGWQEVRVGVGDDGIEGLMGVPDSPDPWRSAYWVPAYSIDIAHAWQVVEKLRADCVFANIGPDPSEGGGYNCQFHWGEGEDDFDIGVVDAEAPTAPHAICLAALKAVGVSHA